MCMRSSKPCTPLGMSLKSSRPTAFCVLLKEAWSVATSCSTPPAKACVSWHHAQKISQGAYTMPTAFASGMSRARQPDALHAALCWLNCEKPIPSGPASHTSHPPALGLPGAGNPKWEGSAALRWGLQVGVLEANCIPKNARTTLSKVHKLHSLTHLLEGFPVLGSPDGGAHDILCCLGPIGTPQHVLMQAQAGGHGLPYHTLPHHPCFGHLGH
eukprot:scaffold133846_cov21-Tisochrysis_lutea.AAC.4